ncbi:outer membrane protein, partial [Helicobacter ailurogastricus]|uniref:outer membrane protein n=1 Tax=Helicobacter ailurogastricus TaxID=1578720 RepID=UPI002554317C
DSGPTASKPADSGPTASKPADSGPTASKPADSGPTASGPDASSLINTLISDLKSFQTNANSMASSVQTIEGYAKNTAGLLTEAQQTYAGIATALQTSISNLKQSLSALVTAREAVQAAATPAARMMAMQRLVLAQKQVAADEISLANAKAAIAPAQEKVQAAQTAYGQVTTEIAKITGGVNGNNGLKATLTQLSTSMDSAVSALNNYSSKINALAQAAGVSGSSGNSGSIPNWIPNSSGNGTQSGNNQPQQQLTPAQQMQQDIATLGSSTATAQAKESAYTNYVDSQNSFASQIESNLLGQVGNGNNVDSQMLVNLVYGMNNYFTTSVNNNTPIMQDLQSGGYISSSIANNFNAVVSSLDSQQINFYQVQQSLDGLIAQVSQARENALAQLNPSTPLTSVAAEFSKAEASILLAKFDLPKADLSVNNTTTANQINAAVGQLNALLAYLKATQTSLASYMKDNKEVITASAPAKGGTYNLPPQSQNGNMYGVDAQIGYKQFFGKSKRWGLRYYGTFSYQHGLFYLNDTAAVDNFVYGAGVDALYNFYESKDGKYTTGLFAGLMFTGSTWLAKGASQTIAMMHDFNKAGGSAHMNTSYFQIPLNIGFRTNVSKHHGFEVGLRIPLATNYYFKGNVDGYSEAITYKRNVSVFINYVYNF